MSKSPKKTSAAAAPAPATPAPAAAPSPASPTPPSSGGPQGLLMVGVVLVLAALAFVIFLIATGRGTAPAVNNSSEANVAAPAPGAPPVEAPPANASTAAATPAGPTPGGGQLLPSGLRHEIIREGRGPHPTRDDTVYFRYELRKFGGPVLESNLTAPRPAIMPVAAVVPGFAEGLTHMRPGGEARFWVPPQLGYGDAVPPGGSIGPTDTLEFRVRLERIAPRGAGGAGAAAPAAPGQ